MRANGSVYVSAVFAALAAYGSYQWWFNPERAIKRQLGDLAATLSIPPSEPDLDRLSRPSRLRDFFADPVRIRFGDSGLDLGSRDAIAATMAGWFPPPGGANVEFVDVQVTLDSDSTARAYMTVQITTRDPRTGQPTFDMREAKVELVKRDVGWLITSAEPNQVQQRP